MFKRGAVLFDDFMHTNSSGFQHNVIKASPNAHNQTILHQAPFRVTFGHETLLFTILVKQSVSCRKNGFAQHESERQQRDRTRIPRQSIRKTRKHENKF